MHSYMWCFLLIKPVCVINSSWIWWCLTDSFFCQHVIYAKKSFFMVFCNLEIQDIVKKYLKQLSLSDFCPPKIFDAASFWLGNRHLIFLKVLI